MNSGKGSFDAIKHIIATIFSAQEALRDLAPEYRWRGLGNLLGDYGEFIAIQQYGLKKAPSSTSGFDALTKEGLKVEVKANRSSATIGLRGEADLLLVLKVADDGTWRELYFGPFGPVRELAHYSKRDNKYTVPTITLERLSKNPPK